MLGGAAVVGALLPLRTPGYGDGRCCAQGFAFVRVQRPCPRRHCSTLGADPLQVGAVLYGGGYVLVAFLQGLVDTQGWLPQRQLFMPSRPDKKPTALF